MPKVSVVLPVYNGEIFLEESIKSILNQTYKDFELIIVDDNSTDSSGVIAQKYAKEHSNVIYTKNEKNLKLPAALNKGFSLASGEYFTWISDDNIHFPNMLARLVEELEKDPEIGLVYFDIEIIDENGKNIGYKKVGPNEGLIFRNVVGACFLYRSALDKKIGGYNESMFLVEDYEYWLRLALATKIKAVNECLLQYRRHPKSLSNQFDKEVRAKGIKMKKKYLKLYSLPRKQMARFYAYLIFRDKFNPFRIKYAFCGLYYSPSAFLKQIYDVVKQHYK